jgi:hypothetical protein
VGAALKAQGRAHEVVGLELSPGAAAEARRRLDRVIEGDVEAVEVPYPDGYFDLLLYADVLLVFRGRGQQRKRLVQMVALYTVQVQGTANGKGRFTRSLKITYQPRKPVQALLAASCAHGAEHRHPHNARDDPAPATPTNETPALNRRGWRGLAATPTSRTPHVDRARGHWPGTSGTYSASPAAGSQPSHRGRGD